MLEALEVLPSTSAAGQAAAPKAPWEVCPQVHLWSRLAAASALADPACPLSRLGICPVHHPLSRLGVCPAHHPLSRLGVHPVCPVQGPNEEHEEEHTEVVQDKSPSQPP